MKLITLDNLNHFKEKLNATNFDLIYPVGVTYTQYPQQASPNELWGEFSTWKVVNYGGAFFRAEGGNANAFIEKSGVLSKQEQSLQSHNHSFSWSGTHSHGITDPGHSHKNVVDGLNEDGKEYNKIANGGDEWEETLSWWTEKGKTGISVNSATISISGTTKSTGGNETRPANFTIKIWKRTA